MLRDSVCSSLLLRCSRCCLFTLKRNYEKSWPLLFTLPIIYDFISRLMMITDFHFRFTLLHFYYHRQELISLFSAHFHHETFSRIHDWNFDIRVQTPGKLASAPMKINFISIKTFWRKSWKLTSDSPWYDACQKVMPVFSFHLKSCERREKMWEDGKKSNEHKSQLQRDWKHLKHIKLPRARSRVIYHE